MNPNIQSIGRIPPGGTILDITDDADGFLWASTAAGLFRKQVGRWQPVSRGMPMVQVSAILSVRKTLVAVGWPEGLVYSVNAGRSWHRAWTDQVETPLSCLAVSPNYNQDRVLLAGTQGEGILRTTDGGRHWQLSNFGLRGFSVFGLASVGVQQTFRELNYLKEIVFAATDDGVYQSPNGGRAWRAAGSATAGMTVLALALSPDFEDDQTLYAGTESGDLFRSPDGGRNWRKLDLNQFSPGAINCLLCKSNDDLWVGTGEAGILRSEDGGETWEPVLSDVPPVLTLKQIKNQVYAGFYEAGLAVSGDEGVSWQTENDLAARRFQWLAGLSDQEFAAAGPAEGIWISSDQGLTWKAAPGWSTERSVLGISGDMDVILAAAPDGLWRSTDRGANWFLVLETALDPAPFYLAQAGELAWGGGGGGGLWFSRDRGQSWEPLQTPFSSVAVIGIGISPHFDTDPSLVVGVLNENHHQVQLWRSTDRGENWTLWHSILNNGSILQMAISGEQGSNAIFGSSTQVIQQGTAGWAAETITSEEAPIQALAVLPDSGVQIVVLADQVLYWHEDGSWQALDPGLQGESVVALQLSPQFDSDHTLFALSRDGRLWRCEFAVGVTEKLT